MHFKTVAPLHDLHLGDKSFQLAEDAFITPIPDWLRKDEGTLKYFSQPDQNEFAKCSHCLIFEYEADSLHSPDPLRNGPRSIVGIKCDLIYLANLALWLQRLPRVGFNLVFHARECSGTFMIDEFARHDRFLYHQNDDAHRRTITHKDLEAVQKFYAALSVIPQHSAPWTAFRSVTSALQMQRNEIRHLLLWIALEALFGNDDGEIRYRLSQRLAFFLAQDRAEASQFFAEVRRGYNVRCKIAHGGWGPKTQNTDESVALTGSTEEFVRRAFVRLLLDGEAAKQLCGKNRGAFLDRLPFAESLSHSIPTLVQSADDADRE